MRRNTYNSSASGGDMSYDRFNHAVPSPDCFFSHTKSQAVYTEDNTKPLQPLTSCYSRTGSSLSEESALPFAPWETFDDPYKATDCAQNNAKSRSFGDVNECGSEADLYGLVSNILEEPDRMDTHLAEGISSSSLKSIWLSNSRREDIQQDIDDESKIQLNSVFQQSPLYPEIFSRVQRQPLDKELQQKTEPYQQFSSFNIADQWLFPSSNGDTDAYSLQTQRVNRVPSAGIPSLGNSLFSKTSLPTIQKDSERADFNTFGYGDGFSGTHMLSDHIEDTVSSFCLPNKINDEFLDPYSDYSDSNQNKARKCTQFAMQNSNALASDIQALAVSENGCYSNQSQGRNVGQERYVEQLSDHQTFKYPKMPAADTRERQYDTELQGDSVEHRTLHCGVNTPTQQTDYGSRDFSECNTQHATYFKHPLAPSGSLPTGTASPNRQGWSSLQKGSNIATKQNQPSQYHNQFNGKYHNQGKEPMGSNQMSGLSKILSPFSIDCSAQDIKQPQRGPPGFPEYNQVDNAAPSGNAFSYRPASQHQMGLNLEGLRKGIAERESELQSDQSTQHTDLSCDSLSSQHFEVYDAPGHPNPQKNNLTEGEKKRGFMQNPYLNFWQSDHTFQRPASGNSSINNPGKPSQVPCFPYSYATGDTRPSPRHLQLNSGSFPSRSCFPNGNSVTLMDLYELLPDNEFSQSYPYLNYTAPRDSPYPALVPSLRSPRLTKTRCGPTSQLHLSLEECYEQWRGLEKERKKTESILAKGYPGKIISNVNINSIPKLPSNPSRVDRLIVDQLREQARVVSLLGKMECLRSSPLHANISSALDRHLEAIYVTQARRKMEFVNVSNPQRQGAPRSREDTDILLLAAAVKDMAGATKKSRTALWCALQMTLPKAAMS